MRSGVFWVMGVFWGDLICDGQSCGGQLVGCIGLCGGQCGGLLSVGVSRSVCCDRR